MLLTCGRVAFVIWHHPRAGRLLGVAQFGIAGGLARDRLLWIGLVSGLRAILVSRLILAALVSSDALIGPVHLAVPMVDDKRSLFMEASRQCSFLNPPDIT
jgi:hypothetical protein